MCSKHQTSNTIHQRYNHSKEYTVAFVLESEEMSLVVLLVSRCWSFPVAVLFHHLYLWIFSIIDKGRKINICLLPKNQIQWLSQWLLPIQRLYLQISGNKNRRTALNISTKIEKGNVIHRGFGAFQYDENINFWHLHCIV